MVGLNGVDVIAAIAPAIPITVKVMDHTAVGKFRALVKRFLQGAECSF
jgi:hypothetical protein